MAVSPCRTPTWWRSGCSHPTTCRSTSFLEAVSSDFSAFVDARVGPRGSLENLSQSEIDKLLDTGQGGLYPLFRRCALAVLNSGYSPPCPVSRSLSISLCERVSDRKSTRLNS